MSTEQLHGPLDMAVAHIEELRSIIATRYADHTGEVHPSRARRTEMEVASCDESIDAIRNEHAQRVTLQHHAADQAQRIADLEAKCDTLKRLHDKLVDERDELKSNLRNTLDTSLCNRAGIEQEREITTLTAERDELRARLAVRLCMIVDVDTDRAWARTGRVRVGGSADHDGTEPSKLRAWCEAVVLCAAEVGRRMREGGR